MRCHFAIATVCNRIARFYQNAQKLTGNTKNGQILNTVILRLAADKGTT